MNTSKSAFFLPLTKPTLKTQDSLYDTTTPTHQTNLNQTHSQNFRSHFQLPEVRNPLLVSKEKQQQMAENLEHKSLNPYEQKARKHTMPQSMAER